MYSHSGMNYVFLLKRLTIDSLKGERDGGEPGYVYKKDAVTIPEVHAASLAAASPPLPLADLPPPCGQCYRYGRMLQQFLLKLCPNV